MKMNVKNHKIKKRLSIVFSLAFLVTSVSTLSSCRDDALFRDLTPDAQGNFEPFDLTISFDSENSDIKTRGTFDTKVNIKSAWVAMFDVATGNLISMAESGGDLGTSDGSHPGTSNDKSYPHQVTLRSLMLNDHNNQVYIAGVANYKDITVKTTYGNDTLLQDALFEVKNINDYKNIAVSTVSAEKAIGDNAPLMAGFWGTGHGNFTVDLDKKVYTNTSTEGKTDPVIEMFDPQTKKITSEHIKKVQEQGMIHLRRLYSHLNINVNVNASNFKKFNNVSIEVLNVPAFTFLQEHRMITDVGGYSSNDDWKEDTHTAADKYGVLKTTGLIKPGDAYTNLSEGAFLMDDSDKVTVTSTGNVANNIKFGYWHYESKHWGLENVRTQNDREKRFTNKKEVFSSLCPSESLDFNNNAPYFIIRAEVETNDGYAGKAEFYIHEGYCCIADGDQAKNDTDAVRDFSTFRNCNYTYSVQINGINSLIQKVTKEDLSGEAYSGVGGELWSTRATNVEVDNTEKKEYDIELPDGQLYWCIKDEKEGLIFGKKLNDSFSLKDKYTAYPTVVDESYNYQNNTFYNNISVNGLKLGEYNAEAEGSRLKLTFKPQSSVNGYLYICSVSKSTDGTTTLYTVYCFNQDGTRLDTPVVEMPYATSENVIIGLEDHTVRWKKVEGADRYTVSLLNNGVGGGYIKEKLIPGQTYSESDAKGNVYYYKIEEDGDDYLKFRFRFARSMGGMLSLVDEGNNTKRSATISVVAHNSETGTSSRAGSITKTYVNPYWNFSSTEWQNGVKGLKIDNNSDIINAFAADQDLRINGLAMYTGNSNKMAYEFHDPWYTFRPNGTGNTGNRGFKFPALFSGKINVTTASASSSNLGTSTNGKARYVVVSQKNSTGGFKAAYTETGFIANATTPGNPKTSTNIPIVSEYKEGDNVYIYGSGDFLYYIIQFTPQDQ